MYTDMEELKKKMDKKKISNEEMARALNIDPSTFYRKIQRGRENFMVGQMHQIMAFLGLDQIGRAHV